MGNAQQMGLGVVCFASVGFLIWFLAALVADAKKTERKRATVLMLSQTARGNAGRVLVASFDRTQRSFAAARVAQSTALRQRPRTTAGANAAVQSAQVLRLSDRYSGDIAKLRWLIMSAILFATICLSTQSFGKNAQLLRESNSAVASGELAQVGR